MPRNTRNFWLESTADGSKTVAVGPKAKTGGLRATLYLREEGTISEDKITIDGHPGSDDTLVTFIELPPSAEVTENADGSKTVRIRKTR